MGVTAMIPNMTFQQLKDEANSRWGEIWDSNSSRLEIMLLCPRKERKLLELHGDMIDHGQPVMGIFHRPRAEAELLTEQGFDPRAASFQFLNISNADMGPWMQQLVTQEGWLRSTVELAPVRFRHPKSEAVRKENNTMFPSSKSSSFSKLLLAIPNPCFGR